MSFPRYERYKDSGVEWLGEVPDHWEIAAFKRVATIRNGQDYKSTEDVDGAYPVIGSGGEFARASNFIFDGESVLLGRKGTIDKPLYICGPFWTVDTMFYTEIAPSACAKYVYYSMLNMPFGMYSTNTALPSMTKEALSRHAITIPSLPEQQTIAAFLDRETTKIDDLVAEQERLIKLLKEKRQAIISHAVTKGLNPVVPLKESGIEWLGEVPMRWSRAFKLLELAAPIRNSFVNGPFGSDLLSTELIPEGIPVIYIRDLKQTGYKRISEVCVSEEKAVQLKFCNVISGDVLVAKVGDPPGLAVVYPDGEPEGIVTQDVIRLRTNPDNALPNYVVYLLNSDFGNALIDNISVESTRTRIGLGEYKQLRVVVPTIQEQLAITAFLDAETAKIDSLVAETQKAIELLKERRSALISAAVTGKIDVGCS